MNKIKKAIAVLTAVTSLSLSAVPVFAEEEQTKEPAVTTAPEVTTEAGTEATTVVETRNVIIAEPPVDYKDKNEGSIVKWEGSGDAAVDADYPAETFGELGAFKGLTYKGEHVDSANYTFTSDGENGVKVVFSESYLKTLKQGPSFFTANFENGDVENFAIVNIEQTAAPTDVKPVAGAPKTGDNGIGMIASLLALSGVTAYISRKKK